MAINFPPNPRDKDSHIDPSSGLKYIFNGSVGGWEAAIQPPVIIKSPDEPDLELEGFLWWKDLDDTLYIYRGGDWIPVLGQQPPVVCAPEPPENPKEGALWWNSGDDGGELYVFYESEPEPGSGGNSVGHWVPITTKVGGSGGATVSGGPPLYPKEGDLWFDTSQSPPILYVWDDAVATWQPVAAQDSGVTTIEVSGALTVDGNRNSTSTSSNPKLSIVDATKNRKGVVIYADASDAGDNNRDDRVVSTAYLKDKGIKLIRESSAGELNLVGSMTLWAGKYPPAGYLRCNGDLVPNGPGTVQNIEADFSQLYALLEDAHGLFGQLPDTADMFDVSLDYFIKY